MTNVIQIRDKEGNALYPITDASLVSDLADVAVTGDYDDLTNKPTIPAAQVQSDWDEADNTEPSFIRNKPSIGKMGVISQTQTWTQAADGGYDYTMSNPVRGLIPQANIDLFESAGAVFNESTGYFELNGLTDISYNEMKSIFQAGQLFLSPFLQNRYSGNINIRTILPCKSNTTYGSQPPAQIVNMFNACSGIEVVRLVVTDSGLINPILVNQINYSFLSCNHLKTIEAVQLATPASSQQFPGAFNNCYSLENITLNRLGKDVSFSAASRLTAASVANMINNALTESITITLHATAYARATADPAVQAALAAHTNVTLASA